jgi:uncharacterized protein YabN with tetrapyrrole methylase and pyrophosphatase domain
VFAKLEEEIGELREAVRLGRRDATEEEVGDLLFTVVNLARKLGVDAETSLAGATRKFVGRFRMVERAVGEQGRRIEDADAGEMNAIWDRVKHDCA